jgi:hypothetical protein
METWRRAVELSGLGGGLSGGLSGGLGGGLSVVDSEGEDESVEDWLESVESEDAASA